MSRLLPPTIKPTNRRQRTILTGYFALWLVVAGLATSWTGKPTHADTHDVGTFKIVELYTSLACSQCPAADKFLAELMEEDDELLALEFHVDYWNTLVHGNDGNFVDPFSSQDHSQRQRDYYMAPLSGRPGVYTPQAVINGRTAAVGSNRRHVLKALDEPASAFLAIEFEVNSDKSAYNVKIGGSVPARETLEGVNIMLASYMDYTETKVTGGENKHRMLSNHHVVTSFEKIGEVSASDDMQYLVPMPAVDGGCVILVQDRALGAIYAAAACP